MTITPAFLLLNLRVIGVILAVLVIVNLFVPARFGWRAELARVSLLNRQIFQAHSVFLILTLALLSALLFHDDARRVLHRVDLHDSCVRGGAVVCRTVGRVRIVTSTVSDAAWFVEATPEAVLPS